MMTEYEMVDLYLEFRNSAAVSFMNFVSASFALLVATYAVGQKLTRSMVAIVVILFTLFTWTILLADFESLTNMVNVASKIKLLSADADSELSWMFKGTPKLLLDFAPIVSASTIIIAYLATLAFFFLTRHHMAFEPVSQPDNHRENNSSEDDIEPVALVE